MAGAHVHRTRETELRFLTYRTSHGSSEHALRPKSARPHPVAAQTADLSESKALPNPGIRQAIDQISNASGPAIRP
jgi:hypothetical protein